MIRVVELFEGKKWKKVGIVCLKRKSSNYNNIDTAFFFALYSDTDPKRESISGPKYSGNWTQLLWWYKGTHVYPGRWDHCQVRLSFLYHVRMISFSMVN